MSRHTITSFSARFDVTVGWDRPLNSYFAQVEDMEAVCDEDDPLVVWVGTSHSEIPTPEGLQPHLARYAIISEETSAMLRDDRAATLDKGDSRLQREMRDIVDKGTFPQS